MRTRKRKETVRAEWDLGCGSQNKQWWLRIWFLWWGGQKVPPEIKDQSHGHCWSQALGYKTPFPPFPFPSLDPTPQGEEVFLRALLSSVKGGHPVRWGHHGSAGLSASLPFPISVQVCHCSYIFILFYNYNYVFCALYRGSVQKQVMRLNPQKSIVSWHLRHDERLF